MDQPGDLQFKRAPKCEERLPETTRLEHEGHISHVDGSTSSATGAEKSGALFPNLSTPKNQIILLYVTI